ncbi:lipoprotein [Noviherbaspirillum aridicola]|uniref:Lipoprotein n=2 Tax=Noviherbaspirillum aridicola TaxID=2849687 RepID=A0ABQ4Q0P6_9BURK|nr:lipoprotein [Noviherbaspirillum aridicola]
MRNRSHMPAALLLAACCALLSACAGAPQRPTLYDLGPLPAHARQALPALPPVAVAAVAAPPWLDSNRMFYRLNYDQPQQPLPYANARWTMSPAQLLLQRIKARIADAGGAPLAAAEGALNVPVLRLETDDFSQVFDSREASRGQVSLRASVYRGRTLLAHKSFARQVPAPSADAGGGAAALAAATDAVTGDLIAWLGTLPLK